METEGEAGGIMHSLQIYIPTPGAHDYVTSYGMEACAGGLNSRLCDEMILDCPVCVWERGHRVTTRFLTSERWKQEGQRPRTRSERRAEERAT